MVYFIADAHLGSESPASELAKEHDLLHFLAHLSGRASMLYAVGDLFDFWFEFPRSKPRAYQQMLSALRSLTRSGVALRFIGGNHDYWAGPVFERLTGGSVHRQPVVETHFGKRLFIAHGDGLPAGDRRYKALKAVIRSRAAIAGFSLVPPSIGWSMARWASGLSEITEERIQRALPPMRTFLETKLLEGFDGAVVGHVHRQCMWRTAHGTAVIVGDWMWTRSVVELGESGFRLLRWDGDSLVPSQPQGGCRPPGGESADDSRVAP
ncbi:MAG: metallophosphoesterase [Candidatus Eisenbacteria bacterium]|nr:metallophosphoesterase [Candidatus Eisenbacteria bacterium]